VVYDDGYHCQINGDFGLKNMYGDRVGLFTGGWLPPWKYNYYDRVRMEALLARWEMTRELFAQKAHSAIRPGRNFWNVMTLLAKWAAVLGIFQLSNLADQKWINFSRSVQKETYGELDFNPATQLDLGDEEEEEKGGGEEGEEGNDDQKEDES